MENYRTGRDVKTEEEMNEALLEYNQNLARSNE